MNPLTAALQGKGILNMSKRVGVIGRRYGMTPHRMDRTLAHFAGVLSRFNCSATLPITGATLARGRDVVEKHQNGSIEFAVHGYYHIDYSTLSLDEQLTHLARARRLFDERGVAPLGFRCPYLRWSNATIAAVKQTGFLYDSSQSLSWDVVDADAEAYRRVLDFYGTVPASRFPALPRLDNGLLRIPYCQPDDEALVERLHFQDLESMIHPWQAILSETHRLGELFTMGLHPERVERCEGPLVAVLRRARQLSPGVWIARLDEVARWWLDRMNSVVRVADEQGSRLRVSVTGPLGITVMARNLEVAAPTEQWDRAYQKVKTVEFALRAERRPFVGVSHRSSPYLSDFLRQQGYIVEPAGDDSDHALYLDRPRFGYEDERPLLDRIESGDEPLLRLGRWPDGARSALCITGDLDALTIWDYGLRLIGR